MREHKDNEWWALVQREKTLVPSNEDGTSSLLDIPHLLLQQVFFRVCNYYLLPRKKWSHNVENFQRLLFIAANIQIWSSANLGLNQKLAYLLSFSYSQRVTSQKNNKNNREMLSGNYFIFSWNYIIQAAYEVVPSWPGYCFNTIIHSNR